MSEYPNAQSSILISVLLLSTLVLCFMGAGAPPNAVADKPNELTQIQNGTATVTINTGASSGTSTITYSPAFASVPKLFVTLNAFVGFSVSQGFLPTESYFQSQTATIWTNMPAADTELYGDVNGDHRISVNFANAKNFRFGVTCTAASAGTGAYLTVMYLAGLTWTELNSAQRVIIDGTNCPTSATGNNYFGNASPSAIPALAQFNGEILRIDGVGGAGIGDLPAFSELWIEYQTSPINSNFFIPVPVIWRVCGTIPTCLNPTESLKTQFVIQVQFVSYTAPSPLTWKFTWKAGVIA